MTLNVSLEEVPDAILEAVMARILRNRQKLKDNQQQIQRPLLQPKPQVRNQGADNRTWKKPEPAATLSPVTSSVILYWGPEGEGEPYNAPPFLTATTGVTTAKSVENSFLPLSGPGVITGQPSFQFTSNEETPNAGNYEWLATGSQIGKSLSNGNFTIEVFALVNILQEPGWPVPPTPTVDFVLNISSDSASAGMVLVATYDEPTFLAEGFASVPVEEGFADALFQAQLSSFGSVVHLALQSQGGLLTFHANGQRVNATAGSDALGRLLFQNATITISASISEQISAEVSIGQIRITKGRAVYGIGNFTPPTRPFYSVVTGT